MPRTRSAILSTALSTTVSTALSTIVAGVLLATGLGPAGAPAHAEPQTCLGQAVTAEGSTGTPGDDVLVVGSDRTEGRYGGAGNDLICVRGPFHPDDSVGVDAGPGDDRVVNESSSGATLTTVLGLGADSYVGNDVGSETVVAGAAPWAQLDATSDVEADTIDARGGTDEVFSGSTTAGAQNWDSVALGDGDDTLHWAGEQAGAVPDLGAGGNSLVLRPGWQGTTLGVDAAQRLATADGRPVLRWSGVVGAYRLAVDHLELTFTGTDAREHLTLQRGDLGPGPVAPALPAGLRRSVDMRGGDDTVAMEHAVAAGSLVGGAGEDVLQAGPCDDAEVRLDGTYTCVDSATTRTATVDDWESVTVPAVRRAKVTGTSGTDRVTARGASVRIDGRGGDDVLLVDHDAGGSAGRARSDVRGGRGDDLLVGSGSHDRLAGGAGADRLDGLSGEDTALGGSGRDVVVGGKGGDRLLGGAGRDRALGQGGTDRCEAEVTRGCERG